MAPSTTALVTVEEFCRLEDPPGFRLELHDGEVVKLTTPKYKHGIIRLQLTLLLRKAFKGQGRALPEMAFRARPEHDLRVADVGWISKERDGLVDREGWIVGAPDIVVEVLSPLNSISEMLKKKALCFSAGCREFWLVDPAEFLVEVIPVDGASHLYRRGNHIPIGGTLCAVDDIFNEDDLG